MDPNLCWDLITRERMVMVVMVDMVVMVVMVVNNKKFINVVHSFNDINGCHQNRLSIYSWNLSETGVGGEVSFGSQSFQNFFTTKINFQTQKGGCPEENPEGNEPEG